MATLESAIRVAIRIRPLLSSLDGASNTQNHISTLLSSPFALDSSLSIFSQPKEESPWKFTNRNTLSFDGSPLPDSIRLSPPLSFTFDAVYDTSNTKVIYDELVSPVIEHTLKGLNATVFAYGQTSSGKTYTIQGSKEEPGIIPLSMIHIFRSSQHDYPDRKFLFRVSYLEIYNEVITDLLRPDNTNLKIHETIERGIYVGNLTEEIVTCWNDISTLVKRGEERRHIGKTNMNEYSSRSHTILRMVIESRDTKEDYSLSMISTLNLIDLAGSERVGVTGAEGVRLKEGAHINKSLLALGTVISKLSEVSTNDSSMNIHIPFRDSKLTRILQPALGGNSQTLIICTMSPLARFFEESLSTLKFATRARSIKTKPEINEIITDDILIKKFKKELIELKKELDDYKKHQEELTTVKEKLEHSENDRKSLLMELNKILIQKDTKEHIKRRRTWDSLSNENDSSILNIDHSTKKQHEKLKHDYEEIQDLYLILLVRYEELESLHKKSMQRFASDHDSLLKHNIQLQDELIAIQHELFEQKAITNSEEMYKLKELHEQIQFKLKADLNNSESHKRELENKNEELNIQLARKFQTERELNRNLCNLDEKIEQQNQLIREINVNRNQERKRFEDNIETMNQGNILITVNNLSTMIIEMNRYISMISERDESIEKLSKDNEILQQTIKQMEESREQYLELMESKRQTIIPYISFLESCKKLMIYCSYYITILGLKRTTNGCFQGIVTSLNKE